jgi:hypothetical protein
MPYQHFSTTCGHVNDYEDTCLGMYDVGEDIIYELVVTNPMGVDVDIMLDPMGTPGTGIAIDGVCPPGDPCYAYSTDDSGNPHGIPCIHLAPGTYYLMIDSGPLVIPGCILEYELRIVECGIQPCEPDFSVVAPGTWPGNTCGAYDDCDLRPSEDHIYEVFLPHGGPWMFHLCPSSYDTVMYVGTTCCGAELGMNDDSDYCYPGSPQSAMIFENIGPGTYYVDIEGYSSTSCGPYYLEIYPLTP